MTSEQNKRLNLRIKPVALLLILNFVLLINAIVIYHYDEELKVGLVFYLYIYFWASLFLLVYLINRLAKKVAVDAR